MMSLLGLELKLSTCRHSLQTGFSWQQKSGYLLSVLLRFRSKRRRDPSPKNRQKDIEELCKIRDEVLAELNVPVEKVPDNLFRYDISAS
jgi:hypothetical protein